jgi:hypothetical protein
MLTVTAIRRGLAYRNKMWVIDPGGGTVLFCLVTQSTAINQAEIISWVDAQTL